MPLPREFLLTDVRCFAGEQRARLRPITLLVGENSTGKTTFLGCYNALHQLFDENRLSSWSPDFNKKPFLMGTFPDIARISNRTEDITPTFEIGAKLTSEDECNSRPYWFKGVFSSDGLHPVLQEAVYDFGEDIFLKLMYNQGNVIIVTQCNEVNMGYFRGNFHSCLFNLQMIAVFDDPRIFKNNQELDEAMQSIPHDHIIPSVPSISVIGPVRSEPKRTYNPTQQTESPQGDHVPMQMMFLSRFDQKNWAIMQKKLMDFGKKSGIFSGVGIRNLGQRVHDPFELQVYAHSDSAINLMDVGYGVSQVLPILVGMHSKKHTQFLLQQPEVHLHPRAQAELATLFAQSFRNDGNSFMIETHSDYIIDRTRIEVRRGNLAAKDVSILYFEPAGNSVKIHNIELDSDGNMENVPPGYRDFFLRESDSLLGFDE